MYAWSVNLINSDGAPRRRDNLSPHTGNALREDEPFTMRWVFN
jgi:hypothetical protein